MGGYGTGMASASAAAAAGSSGSFGYPFMGWTVKAIVGRALKWCSVNSIFISNLLFSQYYGLGQTRFGPHRAIISGNTSSYIRLRNNTLVTL
jgi:hypothetical protein